jgi:hypothetical protein
MPTLHARTNLKSNPANYLVGIAEAQNRSEYFSATKSLINLFGAKRVSE